MNHSTNQRITGVDLARSLAIFGMVTLNFKIVMNASTGNDFLVWFTELFIGRSSALFVILAGIGIAFMTKNARQNEDKSAALKSRLSLIKRGGLLLIIGLLYTPKWQGDILHFYGVYFLIAAFIFMMSDKNLLRAAAIFILTFPVLMFFFNYDQGWDWITLTYIDLWTFNGIVRRILFNGFYPVFPWVSFLIFGMWIGRQELSQIKFRNKLLFWSLLIWIVTEGSFYLIRLLLGEEGLSMMPSEELFFLFSTSVLPPMPQYILSAGSTATILLIGSIHFSERFPDCKLNKWLCQTGRLSLTLYIAHVIIGMSFLEYIGRLENQTIEFSLFSAFVFCICSMFFSVYWLKNFKAGPLEWCFRKIAG